MQDYGVREQDYGVREQDYGVWEQDYGVREQVRYDRGVVDAERSASMRTGERA
jgi:hypothetical protein